MPPSVYTIVVNWNRWAKTLECVEALSRVDYPSLRVVVVDNGSDDPPPTELEREGVEIIASPVNLGYAGGCNLGIRHGLDRSADYLLVLNNDARMDVGALTALVECADGSRENAVLSPRVVDPRGLEEPGTVRRVSPDASRLRRLVTGDPDHAPCAGCDEGHVHDVFQVRGPCLLFRADALRVAGLFDETYFHYFEEVDLVERIRRAGWRIGFCCGSTITHDKGGNAGRHDTTGSLLPLSQRALVPSQGVRVGPASDRRSPAGPMARDRPPPAAPPFGRAEADRRVRSRRWRCRAGTLGEA